MDARLRSVWLSDVPVKGWFAFAATAGAAYALPLDWSLVVSCVMWWVPMQLIIFSGGSSECLGALGQLPVSRRSIARCEWTRVIGLPMAYGATTILIAAALSIITGKHGDSTHVLEGVGFLVFIAACASGILAIWAYGTHTRPARFLDKGGLVAVAFLASPVLLAVCFICVTVGVGSSVLFSLSALLLVVNLVASYLLAPVAYDWIRAGQSMSHDEYVKSVSGQSRQGTKRLSWLDWALVLPTRLPVIVTVAWLVAIACAVLLFSDHSKVSCAKVVNSIVFYPMSLFIWFVMAYFLQARWGGLFRVLKTMPVRRGSAMRMCLAQCYTAPTLLLALYVLTWSAADVYFWHAWVFACGVWFLTGASLSLLYAAGIRYQTGGAIAVGSLCLSEPVILSRWLGWAYGSSCWALFAPGALAAAMGVWLVWLALGSDGAYRRGTFDPYAGTEE